MIKVKDGYAKLIGENLYGDVNRVLLSNGGDKIIGNAKDNIPINNGAINANLNADTIDNYHASDLVKFYLSPMTSDAPADSAKSWFTNTMPSASGAIVYNVPGSEKTIIASKSSGGHGHMLLLNYVDNYLRMLRYVSGSWKTTDWEKISAGYADSAGSATKATNDVDGNPIKTTYLPLSGGLMNSTAFISWNNGESGNDVSDWNINNNGLRIISSIKTDTNAPTQYSTALHVKGRYGFQIASQGGGTANAFFIKNVHNTVWNTLLHSNNYSLYLDNRYYTETEADARFVNVSGDIMNSGAILAFPNTSYIVLTSKATSNYVSIIKWYKGTSASVTGTYDAQIGWHNTGNVDGAIVLLPHPTTSDPWNTEVGLFIGKNTLKWENNILLHSSNYTSYTVKKDGTGATGTWGISITGSSKSINVGTASGNVDYPMLFTTSTSAASNAALYIDADKKVTFNPSTNTLKVGNLLVNGTITATSTISANGRVIIKEGQALLWTDVTSNGSTACLLLPRKDYNYDLQYHNGTNWRWLLDSINYTTYTVTKTGGGASGTWGINISGNANTATKLATARTLWGQSFDGTTNVSGSLSAVANITMSGILKVNTSIADHSKPTLLCIVINCSTPPEGTTITNKNAPGIGFHIANNGWASLIYTGTFKFINSDATEYSDVAANKFIKANSSDGYVLLGGGGHKALSDFVVADGGTSTNSDYLTIHDVGGTDHLPNSTTYPLHYLTSWFNNTGTPSSSWHSGITVKGWTNDYATWLLCSVSTSGVGTSHNLYFRHGISSTWGNWKTILDSSNSSVSKSGETLSVKINGTTQSLTNTDTKVTQTVTSSNATYPLLLGPIGQTASTTHLAYFDSGVTLNPDQNIITANVTGYSELLLNKYTSDPDSAASELYVKWYAQISKTSDNYAGTNLGFPVSNNANGILWMGTYSGHCGGQLGISSNGRIYYRFIDDNSFPTIANGGSWNRVAWSHEIPTLSSLSGISTISASGTSPLTLSASKSGTTVTLSGSIRTADTSLGVVKTTSTVTSTSGYTACPIIDGVIYYKDSNTTYSFSNNAPTLSWGNTSTIGTVGGVALTVTMPANPNTNTTYSAGTGLSLSGTTFNINAGNEFPVGDSNLTDGTLILTSYASDNGFDTTNAVGTVYKRKASCIYGYIKGKLDGVYQAKGSYLTSHQTIHNLTLLAGAFSATTFDPNGSAKTVNIPTHTSHLTNNSGFITSANLSNYLPLSGGTMTGTIITPEDNSCGIRPNTNNYGFVGSEDYWFYLAHITDIYANSITLGGSSNQVLLANGDSKSFTTSVTSGSTALVTSGAVYSKLASYLPLAGGAMTSGARISANNGNLYLGNSSNLGWLYLQDCASLNGSDYWNIYASGSAMFLILEVKQDLTVVGSITAEGGSFYTTSSGAFWSSDRRLKDNISSARNLNIDSLIKEFNWKDTGKHSWGFIALELLEILPEAVNYNKDTDRYSVNYDVAHSAAIASLNAKIKLLELRIKELEDGKASNE